MKNAAIIDELCRLMAALRDPQTGCPWDIKQNFQSVIPYTLEEAYEVADAVARRDMADLCEELGDLLLQIVFHARIAEEQNLFNFHDVAAGICAKLIRRHPHVFGTKAEKAARLDDAALKGQWQRLKTAEKANKPRAEAGFLADIPSALPAAMEAVKLQQKAESVGFDWAEPLPVLAKAREELDELQQAIEGETQAEQAGELGDVLFALANLSRKIGADYEAALKTANQKFRRRFGYIEEKLKQRHQLLAEASAQDMEALWAEAKQREKA